MFKSKRIYVLPKERYAQIKILKNVLGPDGWYISGSFANPSITHSLDIDIFFYNNEAFGKTLNNLFKVSGHHTLNTSQFAETYSIPSISRPVQLIKKYFGTPKEIFENFDLNVCKRAISPKGEYVEDPTAREPLHITKKHTESYLRFIKYMRRIDLHSHERYALLTQLIDENIEDSSILVDYYGDTKIADELRINNFRMYNDILQVPMCRDYLREQAEKRAPELLL